MRGDCSQGSIVDENIEPSLGGDNMFRSIPHLRQISHIHRQRKEVAIQNQGRYASHFKDSILGLPHVSGANVHLGTFEGQLMSDVEAYARRSTESRNLTSQRSR
jgi:hypothetical protein